MGAFGNYLRIRGEKERIQVMGRLDVELPPHTRRKASAIAEKEATSGTTSAYAEKRSSRLVGMMPTRNYLRIRGEKPLRPFPTPLPMELPPHTRRKVGCEVSAVRPVGTTSAYAEKSVHLELHDVHRRNYLRIRGEKLPTP
ncbi:Uncharacterised protein [Corynebacterium ulcerans]|nr:Uncharacterised protein [Corynebacterium ulcerans]